MIAAEPLQSRPETRAAGIVAFMPDPEALMRLVATLEPAVACVFVVLNSAIDDTLRNALEAHPRVSLIEAKQNLGVGVGLNMIVLSAALRGFESVVLFDQDSDPDDWMIDRLAAMRARLTAEGHRIALVAPHVIAASASADSKAPRYRTRPGGGKTDGARAVEFVPTSGSLISLDILRHIGLFRADYFIDGIDLEWSFRAWARGYSSWIVPDCPMRHAIGSGTIRVPLLGRRMPAQRPFRMYCTIRNTLYGLRLSHIPTRWKLAQLAYLPFQIIAYAGHHRWRGPVLKQLAAGVVDGLLGRLGVPPTAPDGRDLPGSRPVADR